jgi:hypothetical protein
MKSPSDRQRYRLSGTVSMLVHTPALEAEQECAMRWGVGSVEDFSSRALSGCERVGRATRTYRVTMSADTSITEGFDGRERASEVFKAGWLQTRERRKDAKREGLLLHMGTVAAYGAAGTKQSFRQLGLEASDSSRNL